MGEAEAFRSLRTAVQFTARPGQPLTLLITSSHAAEGKSTVAANLAETLAETGLRVALVDADLRRPSVADSFGLEGAAGLTTVLIGQAGLDDVLQDWGSSGLHVLTSESGRRRSEGSPLCRRRESQPATPRGGPVPHAAG